MELQLEHLIPEPLKGRLAAQPSDVWAQALRFSPGEKVLFRAASGKGKSTFLHILYGLRDDYEGTVTWNGTMLRKASKTQLAAWRQKELSIVFQDLRLFEEMTVEENILLKNSLTETVSIQQARDWLQRLGLKDKWHQLAGTLSYGERQRVAIVRSLLQPFQWLLLDEPFSHLDQGNIANCISLIGERIREQQAGLLLADLEDNDWFDYSGKMVL